VRFDQREGVHPVRVCLTGATGTEGIVEARGTRLAGSQVHSVQLPGFVISAEIIFGLPDERLTIRHDAGAARSRASAVRRWRSGRSHIRF
jgi:dihydrodipicolinate reductase